MTRKIFAMFLPIALTIGLITPTAASAGSGRDIRDLAIGVGILKILGTGSKKRDQRQYEAFLADRGIQRQLLNTDPDGRTMSCETLGLRPQDYHFSNDKVAVGRPCRWLLWPFQTTSSRSGSNNSYRSSGNGYYSSGRDSNQYGQWEESDRSETLKVIVRWHGPRGVESTKVVDLYVSSGERVDIDTVQPD